jgi:Fur family ferric uptake transcriptional regulator
VAAVLDLVRRRGGRVTAPRRALVESLFAVEGHATAEELVDRVRERDPDAHLSTIYRNLEDLEDLGVVSHSHLGHGAATYQLVDHAHAHFLCSVCGDTQDASAELFEALATRVHDATGFEIEPSHFAVEGKCGRCASAAREI